MGVHRFTFLISLTLRVQVLRSWLSVGPIAVHFQSCHPAPRWLQCVSQSFPKVGAPWCRWGANDGREGSVQQNLRRYTHVPTQPTLCTPQVLPLCMPLRLHYDASSMENEGILTLSDQSPRWWPVLVWKPTTRVLVKKKVPSARFPSVWWYIGQSRLFTWWGDPDLHPQGDGHGCFCAHWDSLLGDSV